MSTYCEHCGAVAGYGHELGHRSDCPSLAIEPGVAFAATDNKRYVRLMAAFNELQAAALKVCDEMDRIYDNKPYPLKYTAPFGAIGELRVLLNKQMGLR